MIKWHFVVREWESACTLSIFRGMVPQNRYKDWWLYIIIAPPYCLEAIDTIKILNFYGKRLKKYKSQLCHNCCEKSTEKLGSRLRRYPPRFPEISGWSVAGGVRRILSWMLRRARLWRQLVSGRDHLKKITISALHAHCSNLLVSSYRPRLELERRISASFRNGNTKVFTLNMSKHIVELVYTVHWPHVKRKFMTLAKNRGSKLPGCNGCHRVGTASFPAGQKVSVTTRYLTN